MMGIPHHAHASSPSHRSRLRRIAMALSLLALATTASAQVPIGLGLHAGVSHAGWNLALVGQYRIHDFQAYLGPSISLNRGLPGNGPVGLDTGIDYFVPSRKDWLGGLVNLDYQLHFFPGSDHVHEFHLSYGLRLQSPSGFFVINQMGYGLFLESAFIESENKRSVVNGFDGLLRLRAGYNF